MAKTPEFDFRDNYSQNYLINANMDYWQRNTTFSTPATGTYSADRWRTGYDGTIGTFSISRQAFTLGQTDVPGNPTYFLRWNQTAAGSGSTARNLSQRIESVRTLAGKTATVSIYLKADTTRAMSVSMFQNFGTGGSPSANVPISVQNITVTTAWQKFTLTFAIPSITGKTLGTNNDDYLGLVINLPINVTMTIDMAQVMVNEGTEAAPFSLYNKTIFAELTACQRYFEKSFSVDFVPANSGSTTTVLEPNNAASYTMSNSIINHFIPFRVEKRAVPVAVQYGNSNGRPIYGAINNAAIVGASTVSTGIAFAATKGLMCNQQDTAAFVTVNFHYTAEAEL